jgi:hypothetical protein
VSTEENVEGYHIRRYEQLPDYTRKWIDNLREEDIQELEESRKMMRSLRVASTIWQKVFLAFFGSIIAIGVASQHLSSWFKSLGHWLSS